MVVLRLRCRHVDWDLLDANGCRFALRGGKATLGLFAEYRIAADRRRPTLPTQTAP